MCLNNETILSLSVFLFVKTARISGDTRIDSNNAVRVVEAIEGESIVLSCQLTRTIGYHVEWSHNGKFRCFHIFMNTKPNFS